MVHIKKRNLLKILIKTVYLSFLSSQHMKKWEYMLIGKICLQETPLVGYYQWCKNTKSLDSGCTMKIKHSPFLAVFSRYGKLLVSPDPTLKKGTFSSCRNSTAICKSQSRSSCPPRFKVTVLKTGKEPPTNRNTPSLAQQLLFF